MSRYQGGSPRLDVALRQAQDLGCEVRPVNRTGEVDIIPPVVDPARGLRRVRHNARNKTANAALVQLLRRLSK